VVGPNNLRGMCLLVYMLHDIVVDPFPLSSTRRVYKRAETPALSHPSQLTITIHPRLQIFVMGADAGFDLVPRISNSVADRRVWGQFIDSVKTYYEGDVNVEVKSDCIEFNVGEHPILPFEGHKCMRFSSKITGKHSTDVQPYLNTVTRIARTYFGSRVQPWNELFEVWGHYEWKEVYDSMTPYEKVS
jgi:hypothetical protein